MATNDLLKQYSTPNKRKEAGVNTAPVSRNKWSVYQKGGGLPEIDWSRIASSLSVGLNQIREDKMAKRVAIEAATDAQMAEINKLRDSQPASAMIMRGTERYKELLSVHMGLVRAGLRTPTETKIFTQNVMNDFGGMKSIMDTYTTWQDAALKKIDDGEATTLTEIGYNSIEGLGGTLEGVEMYFNEATGTMQLVKMLEDGKGTGNFTIMPNADKNPENFYNPAQVLGAMKFNEKVIDYNVATGAIVESLGTFVQAYAQEDGSVRKDTNFRDYFDKNTSMKNNDGSVMTYDEYLSSQAAPFTSNFNDTMQVLFSNGYQNDNPNAANYIDVVVANGKFLIKKDGKNLTQVPEDLQTAAENIIKNKIDAGIDRKVESTTPFNDLATKANFKDEEKEKSSKVDFINRVISDPDNNLEKVAEGTDYRDIESIEMLDKDDNVTTDQNLGVRMRFMKLNEAGTSLSPSYVELRDFVNGKRFTIDEREFITKNGVKTKNPNYKEEILNDMVSDDEILRGYLGNMEVKESEIDEYMKAFKGAGNTAGKFISKNYNRKGVEIIDTGSTTVKRKNNKEGTVSLIVTEVLENKEEDSPFKAFEAAANAKGAPDKAKKDFKQYKVNMISAYINKAFSKNKSLRGKPFNLVLENDGSLTVVYNNQSISLGKTLENYGTSGSVLVQEIQDEINLRNVPQGTCINGRKIIKYGVTEKC